MAADTGLPQPDTANLTTARPDYWSWAREVAEKCVAVALNRANPTLRGVDRNLTLRAPTTKGQSR